MLVNQNKHQRKALKWRSAPQKMLTGPSGPSGRGRAGVGVGGHGRARSRLQGSQINLTAAMQDCGLGWHSQTLPDISKEATYLQFHVEFPKPPNPSWAKQNTSVGKTYPVTPGGLQGVTSGPRLGELLTGKVK